MTTKYTIDAKGKKLGRIASSAAALLMGKNSTAFSKNKVFDVRVHITNASGLDINPKKARATIFYRHSGYPGGLKEITLAEYIVKKGYKELVRKTIFGMLPTNTLRSKIIKNLVVTE